MEATKKRNIQSGEQFNELFPKAYGKTEVIKQVADVYDTLDFMPKAVHRTLADTVRLAAMLDGGSTQATCKNIWHFVYDHIQYKRDLFGKEQVRRPARSWRDRNSGVDCDCYTVFISSILTNLKIPHLYRVCKYNGNTSYQHVYPVALSSDGEEFIIDCVVDRFNYEVPFTEKLDRKMELHYLNGVDDAEEYADNPDLSIDAEDLLSGSDLQGGFFKKVGNFIKKNNPLPTQVRNIGKNNPDKPKVKGRPFQNFYNSKIGKGIRKFTHVTNKIDPGMALIRSGILAGMKSNIFRIATRLRWGFAPFELAKTNGISLQQWQKLKTIIGRLENMHHDAGGKRESIKKAILSGKGNKDKRVPLNGLGSVPERTIVGEMPLIQTLGADLYNAEYGGVAGLGEAASIATGAAITAAMGVLTAIAAMLKQVGDIKDSGQKVFGNNKNVDRAQEAANEAMSMADGTSENRLANPIFNWMNKGQEFVQDQTGMTFTDIPDTRAEIAEFIPKTGNPNLPTAQQIAPENNPDVQPSFVDKAKTWVKENPVTTAVIGVGTAGLIGSILYYRQNKKQPAQLSGTPNNGNKSKGAGTKRKNNSKKSQKDENIEKVALLK